MRLGKLTNGRSNEYQMQDAMSTFLSDLGLTYREEFHIQEVKRRADFLVIKNGLINIEAKCNDFKTVMKQMNDHATYCDYCFAYIPDYSMTPKWFKKALQEKGYGLIIHNWKNNTVTEVLEAHHNKPENMTLRNKVLHGVRYELIEQ